MLFLLTYRCPENESSASRISLLISVIFGFVVVVCVVAVLIPPAFTILVVAVITINIPAKCTFVGCFQVVRRGVSLIVVHSSILRVVVVNNHKSKAKQSNVPPGLRVFVIVGFGAVNI